MTYLLDGAMHNHPYDNYNMPLPFPDALQGFRVATNPTTNFDSGSFGRIQSQAGDPRILQFGIKYGF